MSYDKRLLNPESKIILIDMDGVITAFDDHFIQYAEYTGFTGAITDFLKAKEPGSKTRFDKWLVEFGSDFWATMPWTNWGKELYQYCKSLLPTVICTAPTNDPSCSYGKHQWINNHIKDRNYMICPAKHSVASSRTLLIDDTPKKINNFLEAGGTAILFHKDRLQEIKQEIKIWANS